MKPPSPGEEAGVPSDCKCYTRYHPDDRECQACKWGPDIKARCMEKSDHPPVPDQKAHAALEAQVRGQAPIQYGPEEDIPY